MTSRLHALAVWAVVIAFVVGPLVSFLAYGFFSVEGDEVSYAPTLATFAEAVGNPSYRATFMRTMGVGATVAAVNLVVGYAVALFISRRSARTKTLLLFAVAAPLLLSYIIKIYAMRSILGTNGMVNSALTALGIVDEPIDALLFNLTAVRITLVVVLLPFAVLPIFIALDRVPASLLLAARDLGAGEGQVFRHIVLPMSLPGAIIGALSTFILAAGDFLVPELVGGIEGFTYGRLVFSQFGLAFNWPLGAALSVLLLLVALGIIVTARRLGNPEWML